MTIFPPTYMGNSRPCHWCSESYPISPLPIAYPLFPKQKMACPLLLPKPTQLIHHTIFLPNPPLSLVGQLYPSSSHSLPQILDLKPPVNTNFMTRPLIGQMDSSLASLFTWSSLPLVLTALLQVHKPTPTLQPLPLFAKTNINHFLSHI